MASQNIEKNTSVEKDCNDVALEEVLEADEAVGQILEKMSDKTRLLVEQKVEKTLYSGPLPPADQIKKYEEAMPGAADRIFKMAENQATHRQTMETEKMSLTKDLNQRLVKNEIKNNSRGLLFGFIITLVFAFGGFLLILLDKPVSGFVSLIVTVASLAGAFIYRKRKQQDDDNENHQDDKKDE
ncbi:DUF2335 domain-containing protein [Listeria sp. PSOL-1]|uniref:DUF2335 domain-containing protein n=1 Tax=Listeria sp. PSOL-1 TaxID=1844999 RepID=UPI0013CFC13F|nr:DUF2335 domain-containing protein [Listeria sp. PSOL-1]